MDGYGITDDCLLGWHCAGSLVTRIALAVAPYFPAARIVIVRVACRSSSPPQCGRACFLPVCGSDRWYNSRQAPAVPIIAANLRGAGFDAGGCD